MKKFLSDVLIDCNLTVSGSSSLGAATGVTVDASDNSNKIATTAWVKSLGFSTANTTYLLDVPANTTNFRLIGSDSSTDTITLSAAGASSITRVSASELRITSSDTIDYVNSVSLVGTDLTFASVGNGFAGTIDLSGITGSFNAEEVQTLYENIRNVSGGLIQKGTPLAVVPGQTSGNVSDVVPAAADDPARMPAIFIANEDLAEEAEGLGVVYGNITGIDTSAFDSGTTVYVAAGGGWTAIKPTGTNLIQNLGIITKSHASNGGGVVMGAGRSNDVPNIANGYAWVGNAQGVATPTQLGSNAFTSYTDHSTQGYITSVVGDGSKISTSTDLDTGVVTVNPIMNSVIAETGTALVTSGTIWNYINDSILDIAPIQSVGGDGSAISTVTDVDTGQVTVTGIFNNQPAEGSTALVNSGGIWSYIDSLAFDEYTSWNLKTNGVQRTTVASGGALDIVAGTNVSVSYGAGGVVTISSTETLTELSVAGNILSYRDETGAVTEVDLSLYLDDTNLARLVTGTLDNGTGIATFTRSDDTTFDVDFSALFDDVNTYADSLAFSTTTGVLTVGRSGSLADLTVDLDGRYLTSIPAEYVTATEMTNYSISPRFGSTIGMNNDSAIIEFQDSNAYTKAGYWSNLDAFLINGDGNNNNNIVLRTGNILVNQNQFISGKLGVNGRIELSDDAASALYQNGADGAGAGTVIESFSANVNIGAFLDFTIYNDGKESMRSGTLQLVFNLDQVMFNEVNTMDIGDTTPCTLTAVNNAGTIDVIFTTPDPTFHIKYHVRTL